MSMHTRLPTITLVLLFIIANNCTYQVSIGSAADSPSRYDISNGEIVKSLTREAGNPERGEQIVLDRERGDCVVCHAMPLPNREFHGTVGPPLEGVGRKYTSGALRLRLVDAKAFNPQSVMPAYHKVRDLFAVRPDLRNTPILTAQEIEDVVAYLATLTSTDTESSQPINPVSAAMAPSALPSQPAQPAYAVDGRRSGYTYLAADTQQLQNDAFANPGMLWVERGGEMWIQPEGGAHQSCTNCHGEARESMRGVRARYPRFDGRRKKLINLEQQINRCRQERLHVPPYAYESEALLALTTYIAYQSRGVPIAPQIDAATRSFFIAGKQFFMQRRGQLDLACTHCHDQLAGQRLRGEVISQGQSNGFPIYRQLWQTLGSSHHMFAWCNTAIRAEPFALGSDEYVNLELYMAWRARGLPVESPAIRR